MDGLRRSLDEIAMDFEGEETLRFTHVCWACGWSQPVEAVFREVEDGD